MSDCAPARVHQNCFVPIIVDTAESEDSEFDAVFEIVESKDQLKAGAGFAHAKIIHVKLELAPFSQSSDNVRQL